MMGRSEGWGCRLVVAVAVLLMAGALALGGCGGGSSDGSETGSDSSSGDGSTVVGSWSLTTGANAADLVESHTFTPVTVDLATLTLGSSASSTTVDNGSSTRSLQIGGATVLTLVQDTYGPTLTVTASNASSSTRLNLVLSGSSTGSVTVYSDSDVQLTLGGVTIASADGPALNIQSTQRAFVVQGGSGVVNTLSSPSTWTARTLADGTAMDMKATVFSEGPLIFSGEGTLAVSAAAKHALASDAHVRVRGGGLTLTATKKDGIRANDAFVMDGGSLLITTPAGKGIKVEGREDDTTPLGFIAINDGALTITSHDKAITASWEGDEDGETTSTADDPDPRVTINGGTFSITTTGTPYEDTDTSDGDDSLSPEGIEAKSTLTINGGTLTIRTTDDGLNAGSAIVINGGRIDVKSSVNDAVDSNGTMTITGGLLVADGASGAEGGLDTDNGTFQVTGGTFVAIGGRNSTVTAAASTQSSVALRSVSAGLLVIRDAAGGIAFAAQVPESSTGVLVSSPNLLVGSSYTVIKGGTLGSWSDALNWLYLGASGLSGGTAGSSFTISSTVTSL